MGYKLNKTDGTLLVDLVDGQLDTTTTSIGLIGKNYTGFGETLNENMIKMLENFANTSAPSVPLKGQLWYDTASARIKVYDGTSFKESGGPIVSTSEPNNMVSGDLWLNSLTNQLYFYDGTDLTLAGPVYTAQQGKSGFETVTALDTQNFVYRGTADSALSLTDSQGNTRTPAQLLPADSNGVTIGTLTVSNSGGLTIGTAQNNIQKIVGTSYVTENQLSNHDWKVRVRKTTGYVDAIVVDTDLSNVGIFKSQPLHTLHVGGDVKVDGQLIVTGTTTSIDTQNLRVEDKNIELAIQSDSTVGNNAAVDGGGIILKSSDLDKEFVWRNSTQSWTSSENIKIIEIP